MTWPGWIFIALLTAFFSAGSFASETLFVSGSRTNDLVQVLRQSRIPFKRFDSPARAIAQATPGAGVLILSDNYPHRLTSVPRDLLDVAFGKRLHVYLEFADLSIFPELNPQALRTTVWERGIVVSNHFGPLLPGGRIVTVSDCHYVPVTAADPWLVVGRVAGFDRAVYGVPTNSQPLLFSLSDRRLLLSTTRLSSFVSGRYAPHADWEQIWKTILHALQPSTRESELKADRIVSPAYTATEKLPRDAEKRALAGAAQWLTGSGLLVTAAREQEIKAALLAGHETAPIPPQTRERGDGTRGILEGYASGIQHDGLQLQRLPLRADCTAESAMVLALNHAVQRKRSSGQIAGNLLDYLYFHSDLCAGPRGDPEHPAFGLIAWGSIAPAWLVGNYGDDNARALLATCAAAAAMNETRWNGSIARALLANFRTTGKHGFRGDRIDVPALAQQGWKQFRDAETINYSPHFESGLWACYLWAYRATGYRPFLDQTKHAIAMTMEAYPERWRWQDNMERARMLLCLAWLVAVEDTSEHRSWLKRVGTDLLRRQQPSGAIHEWLGGKGGGHYQIPPSNEAYGTGETPLIQENGDPASDQLYTTGFALLGLHEAAAITGDTAFREGEEKLAGFLCRIQTRSNRHSFLNGWWFRAFDDRRWDYWSSSADIGWGAWSMEAGWAQAWTAATFALREKKTSLWELTARVNIRPAFDEWRERMLEPERRPARPNAVP